MGEANCNFDNFLPGGVDCSGFGTCDFNNVTQKSFCVCEAGRRAIGDLVFDPIDCDQSDLGITICWSILLVCSSISAIYGTYELIEQALMPKTNRGLYLNIALATAAAILACVAATLKLFEEEQRLLGEDVLFSVIVPTVGVLYWVSVILFIDRLFVAIVGSTKTGVIDVVTTSAPRITLVTLVGISFILPPVLCGVDQGRCFNRYLDVCLQALRRKIFTRQLHGVYPVVLLWPFLSDYDRRRLRYIRKPQAASSA